MVGAFILLRYCRGGRDHYTLHEDATMRHNRRVFAKAVLASVLLIWLTDKTHQLKSMSYP